MSNGISTIRHQVTFTVGPGEGNRSLETYLKSRQKLSVKAVRKVKHHGLALVNEQPALFKGQVREGDVIVLVYPPESSDPYLLPEDVPLDIVFEDEEILVLNKQPRVCVHPTKGYPRGTLANGILYYWMAQGKKAAVHVVNRLDRNTSGLVLVAKSAYAAQQLFNQQTDGIMRRFYQGLVSGVVSTESGTIDLPIARADDNTTRRTVCPAGQPSVTHYRVLKRFLRHTMLELALETGRTHQIRVHLSHQGYPLVGDALYGGELYLLKRQFLHACRLAFLHPVSRREMEFIVPLPSDLQRMLGKI